MKQNNKWNAQLYDDKMDFVADYGKDIVSLLDPEAGENIIDLGCGTGDLTSNIAQSGANVVGLDASLDMLEEASRKYPQLTFQQADARNFNFSPLQDAVFSNAALHWIKTPEPVISSVYQNLKPGGRFVAELGGKGNVHSLIQGLIEVLENEYQVNTRDAHQRIPWYFPSIGEYTALLESTGFRVTFAQHFDRPTVLPDEENGLNHWLASFSGDFFPEFSNEDRENIYEKVKKKVRYPLFNGKEWVADYKRLRIVALKESHTFT